MMSSKEPQDHETIVRRVYEAFNARDLDALDELLSPDFTDHTPSANQPPGPDGLKQMWLLLWGTFRTIRIEVEDVLTQEEFAAMYGTFATEVPGQGEGRLVEFVRIEDCKITDLWNILAVGRRA
jgi:predicted SnoaL-like aldol condensation-catalyzing enzyme